MRNNRGVGGQVAQMEKVSNVIGADLQKNIDAKSKKGNGTSSTGHKRTQAELDNPPENLEENTMAPHKRARVAKNVSLIISIYLETPSSILLFISYRPLFLQSIPAITLDSQKDKIALYVQLLIQDRKSTILSLRIGNVEYQLNL